jgi:hypothetical protein
VADAREYISAMKNWALPWLVPLVLVVAVVLAAVSGSLVIGIVALLAGYVGVPIAFRAYAKTRAEMGQPTLDFWRWPPFRP